MLTATERVWDYFCIIAAERGVTVGQLLSYVEAAGALFLARMSGLPLRCARHRKWPLVRPPPKTH